MVLSCLVMSDSLRHPGLQPSRLLCPWDSVDKNTGVGCHALLQGIFPTQESKPSLPYCRQIVYHLSHRGNPRILKWVVYPFSRGTSWPGNWTRVSCIVGGVFTIMSYQGSPRILKWVVYPFSSGSSWPRNRTRASCIAGGFFTNLSYWGSRSDKLLLD